MSCLIFSLKEIINSAQWINAWAIKKGCHAPKILLNKPLRQLT